MGADISVEVVYALPEKQQIYKVFLSDTASVEQAIIASGVLDNYPEIDLFINTVGIFSQPVALKDRIKQNDRIEIYRALLTDPKELRRKRAAKKVQKEAAEKK